MTCRSFHQVEIECDHKYLTYIQITTPDACMQVLGNIDRTSVLSDSTISAIFVLLDSTKNRYLGTGCWRQNRGQKIVLCHRGLFFVLYFVADSSTSALHYRGQFINSLQNRGQLLLIEFSRTGRQYGCTSRFSWPI